MGRKIKVQAKDGQGKAKVIKKQAKRLEDIKTIEDAKDSDDVIFLKGRRAEARINILYQF